MVQIFSGIFFAGLAGWLSMANGTKLSFIQQACGMAVTLYGIVDFNVNIYIYIHIMFA